MAKRFRTGFFCGRLQHIHKGHEEIINTGLELCENMVVFIGSAQEYGTERNPYNFETRKQLMHLIYPEDIDSGRLRVIRIDDLTHEGDITTEWGKYVLKHYRTLSYGNAPDLMLYGNDEARSKWFNKNDIAHCSELIITRLENPISATYCRERLLYGDEIAWKVVTNSRIHHMYESLRDTLFEIPAYTAKLNIK
jgi:nicotinamide-nucleotide adenylyltransferase